MLIPFSGADSGWSPVPAAFAQAISPGCDRDGDGFIKDSGKCRRDYPNTEVDCDDSNHDPANDCSGGGNTGGTTLDISYDFDGVSTSIRAEGEVECGQNRCEFNSTSVIDTLKLPSSLRDLIAATVWRGTVLDPDKCFGSSDEFPNGGVAQIKNHVVYLARANDGLSPWYASVGGDAFAVNGTEVRRYIFNFEGCGPQGECGDFAPGSMAGEYVGGDLMRIDSHGNDRKFESIPCRCTRSNTPDCPAQVPVPTPQMSITVSEVPPP